MIVEEHHMRGGCEGRLLEHFPRVHNCGIEAPHREDADAHQAMARIEQRHAKLLDRRRSVQRQKMRGYLSGRVHAHPISTAPDERPPPQLNRREYLSGAHGADAGYLAQVADRRPCKPLEAAGALENVVGEQQRVRVTRSRAQNKRQQFVVAEVADTATRQLLARTIVRSDLFHLYSERMYRWSLPACVCLALLAAGCGEPPDKEMNQAQGAIDAARAAGADRYAASEFKAATDALGRSRQAVAERDYRLALNDALESRERAQNAAREAADTMARVRGELERQITEVSVLLDQAARSMAAAEKSRVPSRAISEHQKTVASSLATLQEARAGLSSGDYTTATAALTGTKERIAGTITALDQLTASQSPRRRR